MKLLEERIRKDGVIKPGNVLKVDSFLNHQMDVEPVSYTHLIGEDATLNLLDSVPTTIT